MLQRLLFVTAVSTLGLTCATAQTTDANNPPPPPPPPPSFGADAGADVIVGDLQSLRRWGSIGGTTAYSVGTVSCNIGDVPLNWIRNTNQHPVIAQNMYRVKDGIFEQIGQSWVKHGFLALQQSLCEPCQAHPNGTALGVGCSDPYSASLNGSHTNNRLGPKFQINAFTGEYPYPPFQGPITNDLSRRVQVLNTDLDPTLNPSAVYFVEGQYVTPDDAAAGNQNNNNSYRRINVSGGQFGISFIAGHGTRREMVALNAWQEVEPNVEIQMVDVPGEGRFHVGSNVIDLGGGQWRYIYAIQNQTSDRSGASLAISFPPMAEVSNINFRDVPYHSGSPLDGTDWTVEVTPGSLRWESPETFSQNANANALRWGTAYTFWFDADMGPTPGGVATLGLFKPGTPSAVEIVLPVPGCYADCDQSTGAGVLDVFDFLCFQNQFVNGNAYACDCDTSTGPGVCDVFDFLCFQDAFVGACQ